VWSEAQKSAYVLGREVGFRPLADTKLQLTVEGMKQATTPLSYPGTPTAWEQECAQRGRVFEIVRAFVDADGDNHEPGEAWTIVGTGFNKFEDVMWIGVRTADGREWLIPLGWRDASQADVLERWAAYVRAKS